MQIEETVKIQTAETPKPLEAERNSEQFIYIFRKKIFKTNLSLCFVNMRLQLRFFKLPTILLTINLIVNLFYNCSETVNGPHEMQPYNYSPLNPGEVSSYWKYFGYYNSTVWFRDSNWVYQGFEAFNINFSDSSFEVIDSTKREIIDETEISIDNTTYIARAFVNTRLSIQPRKEAPKWLYWNSDDGIYSMGGYSITDTLFVKGLKLKYPVKSGEIWQGHNVFYNGVDFFTRKSIFTKCISVNEVISTPIGTFECYVFINRTIVAEDVSGFYDHYQYYAPDVGLICQVVLNISQDEIETQGFVSVLMLYDYQILN